MHKIDIDEITARLGYSSPAEMLSALKSHRRGDAWMAKKMGVSRTTAGEWYRKYHGKTAIKSQARREAYNAEHGTEYASTKAWALGLHASGLSRQEIAKITGLQVGYIQDLVAIPKPAYSRKWDLPAYRGDGLNPCRNRKKTCKYFHMSRLSPPCSLCHAPGEYEMREFSRPLGTGQDPAQNIYDFDGGF
jgi:hypothetical protein